MPERITHPAPAQVTTTVQQPSSHSVDSGTFTIRDVSIVLGIIVAITIIAGFFLNRASVKRTEDRTDAADRTAKIMDAIKSGQEGAARDVRELSDKVKDGRTVLEKDIEAIRANARHDKANALQASQAVTHLIERSQNEVRDLAMRMTTQEEKTRAQDVTIGEIKALIREKFDEVRELVKEQGEVHTAQFREVAQSLREARDAKMKV